MVVYLHAYIRYKWLAGVNSEHDAGVCRGVSSSPAINKCIDRRYLPIPTCVQVYIQQYIDSSSSIVAAAAIYCM